MPDFLREKGSLIAGIAAALLLLAVFFLSHEAFLPKNQSAIRPSTDIVSLRANMLRAIRTDGADAANQAFKNAYASSTDFEIQHNAAHIFGESLYEAEGLSGVAVCDSSLNFGCYHGFFTRAVAAEGLGVIVKLDEVCSGPHSAHPPTCQHGLGHGILDYLGFTNLDKALAQCKRTNQPNPLAGCTSGVFMEYNEPLITAADGSVSPNARPLDPSEPYAPCPKVPEEFRSSCYHELPQWWNIHYKQDFKKIGALCNAVTDEKNRNACFLGIGGIAAPTALYDVKKTLALCALMPSRESESTCVVYSAWAFVLNIGNRARGIELCKSASYADQDTCPK